MDVIRLINLLAMFVANWSQRILTARIVAKKLKDFPLQSRVEFVTGCHCTKHISGQQGTVLRLSDMGDYEVQVDGKVYDGMYVPELKGKPESDYVCHRGMRRLDAIG